MARYVDKQVAAYRKVVGEALAGKGLRDGIRQLQEKSKVRDTLQDLPARGAITGKRQIGRRAAATNQDDLLEASRTFHTTLRELKSTDAIFTFEFYNVKTITFTDGSTHTYLDYDPNPPE